MSSSAAAPREECRGVEGDGTRHSKRLHRQHASTEWSITKLFKPKLSFTKSRVGRDEIIDGLEAIPARAEWSIIFIS
jgi:hypothetical protein